MPSLLDPLLGILDSTPILPMAKPKQSLLPIAVCPELMLKLSNQSLQLHMKLTRLVLACHNVTELRS